MSVSHQGFAFHCDNNRCEADPLKVEYVKTERTAIAKARRAGWFVGRVKATAGAPNRHPVRHLVLCNLCAWWCLHLDIKVTDNG
jgi:hypothetical protein